jgi:hypothetical protein
MTSADEFTEQPLKTFVWFRRRKCPVPGCGQILYGQDHADAHFTHFARGCKQHDRFNTASLRTRHEKAKKEKKAKL